MNEHQQPQQRDGFGLDRERYMAEWYEQHQREIDDRLEYLLTKARILRRIGEQRRRDMRES